MTPERREAAVGVRLPCVGGRSRHPPRTRQAHAGAEVRWFASAGLGSAYGSYIGGGLGVHVEVRVRVRVCAHVNVIDSLKDEATSLSSGRGSEGQAG